MISRMRTNGLAVLVLGLGLGGWVLMAPIARAQGVDGAGPGFGGFGDSHPGMYGVGYGGLGFGMPGWGGNGSQFGDIGVGRFSGPTLGYYGFGAPYYGHGDNYPYLRVRGLGFSYPWYGLGYGYGYGYPYHRFAHHAADAFFPVDGARTLTGPMFPLEPVTTVPPENVGGAPPYYAAPAPTPASTAPAQGRYLGIDEEPVVDANGTRGMKVAKVYSGTAAEKAGLKTGDVIHSINGYLTESRGNLAWIIAHAASNNVLKMDVLTAADGKDHTVTASVP